MEATLPLLVTKGKALAVALLTSGSAPRHNTRPAHGDHGGSADRHNGAMSGAPSRAASAVRSSGCNWDSRSASTRFS
ncbi:hypothetical protein GCM10010431_04930 [Streptomyces kunmingensis]